MNTERSSQKIDMDEAGIDIKEIFSTFKRYYKSLLAIVLLTTLLVSVNAYFATNIYQSEALINLAEPKQAQDADFMASAIGRNNSNLELEMAVFQSPRLASKALEDLNLGTRYFTIKHLRHIELYKDSPFVVTFEYLSPKAMKVPIRLLPSKEGSFRLIIEPTLKEKVVNTVRSFIAPLSADDQPIVYDKRHSFGEKIETPWFTIAVQQVHELGNDEYYFTMLPNQFMTGFIGKNLSVSPYAKGDILIALSFQDNVPLRAKEILDALSSAFIRENMEIKSESANKKILFIDMQIKAINKVLEGSAENLERYRATNIVVDLSAKAMLTSTKLSELETQLYDIKMNIDVMENILNYIETHKDMKGINIGSAQRVDPTIVSIMLELQKTALKRSSLLIGYTESHVSVIRSNRKLLSLRGALQEAIHSSLRTLKKRKQSLDIIIKDNRAKMQMLPGQERKLAQLTRNFMVNEKIYSYLLEKRAETAIIESSTVSETRIIESASVANLPFKPKRGSIILAGFLLGLIFGIVQALLRAYIDNTVKRVEDIEKLTTIPVYGSIPFLHSKKNLHPYREALRVIRTNLEFSQNTGKSKLITITSSVPSEGKTTTITELGKIIAKGNKKVIIIDMDMRLSIMHEKFNLSNKIGMSTLLAGRNSLEEVIHKTGDLNPDVITSGPIPPNPSELMMSGALEGIIKELKSNYDYILLDSPPIGMVTDAMIIMRMSDINLIVLKAKYSKKDFLNTINRFVDDHDLNAGIILNGVEFNDTAGYGYGYGYSYGSKSGNDYYNE